MDLATLTEEERSKLNPSDQAKYDKAITYCKDDWANGPYGGWVRGHNLLKELGWTESTRTEGHRTFITLNKPIK